ncbi:hypothetical protein [Chamaesiphon minutus]|uniref:Uncharacterized protein n=1 Tax=Chamaesiphon minutus (strain ATCC 27169 / PCC 6605) TaxID=1173020 RepID=K9UDT5_CHAP6|nr:hypothetical protein [Chamaesiphon minutus]AFY92788.1 hypothetical protein Cha6605_1644 [Chamaesiphon minutus PCC 6605]
MPQFEWIDLPVWTKIKVAASEPEEADLARLWQEVEDAIVNLGCLGRLQVAGEAISQITDLYELRSQLAFESIQAVGSDDGPVMSEDAFDRYVRQSMQIDFDVYIEPLSSLPRKVSEFSESEIDEVRSVVAEIDRKVLLEAILPEPVDPEIAYKEAIGLAHDEDVSAWGAAISARLEEWGEPVSLLALQGSIEMPLVQVWLALLLNGIPLEQRGDFYQTEQVWVLR